MSGLRVKVRRVALPDGPRGTMARLRAAAHPVLLESALPMSRQAQWSYIAGPARATLYTDETSTRLEMGGAEVARWIDPFEALAAVAGGRPNDVSVDGDLPEGMDFVGGWVGVLGYDLARQIERLPERARHDPAWPRQWWAAVDQVLGFHHPSGQWWQATVCGTDAQRPWFQADPNPDWDRTLALARADRPPRGIWCAGSRQLLTSREQFERGVAEIREAIARGDVLQVNLTRREQSTFEGDAWALYEDLAEAHPAPFAAFVEGPGFAIASCSPERFLRRRGDEVEARPIKGTVARGIDAAADADQRAWLAASIKDRAENLMIVDLMRNDLGRVAVTGSVRVPELFALEPYASVWQMVSTVQARLHAGCGVDRLLRACWPPGSMTGAPKLKAMQIIEALEPVRRGAYAGSVGYLDCRGNMDLSVVIRTAIVVGGKVMAQFGGGIVADSEPAAEWAETVAKGRRIVETLARGGATESRAEGRIGHSMDLPPPRG